MLNLRLECRRWQTSLLFTLFSVFALIALTGFTIQRVEATTPLTAMIPLDTPVAIAVDTSWLWKNTTDLRAQPEIRNELQAAEKSLGFSLENDLFLWSGQSALVLSDINDNGPSFALLMQVRDAEHMITSPRLEALLHKAKVNWLAMNYKGVAIRRAEISADGMMQKIAIARVDDWLVITYGDGVIRKMVDTHAGDSPSLATHPSFKHATSSLPNGGVGQIYLNGQGIIALIKQHDAKTALQLSDTELGHFFLAGELRATEKHLLADCTYCTTLTTTQQVLKTLHADAGVVTGTSLTQVPQGIFATLLLHNPDKWLIALATLRLSFADSDGTRKDMQQDFDGSAGYRAILQLCAGEMGLNIAWNGTGFDVTLAGETDKATDATNATTILAKIYKNFDIPVQKVDTLYTSDFPNNFPSCWTSRQQWFLAASNPNLLSTNTAFPAPVLPRIAKDADFVAFGNLLFVPSMLKTLEAGNIFNINSLAKYDFGQWASAVKIEEDGSAVHCQVYTSQAVLTGLEAVATALLFRFSSKGNEKEQQEQSLSNLRQLAVALMMAAQDNAEIFPEMKTLADMKQLGIKGKFLISPRTNEAYSPNPNISGKALGDIEDTSETIVFYEKTPGDDGSHCVAFMDGHSELIQAKDWEAVKRKSKLP